MCTLTGLFTAIANAIRGKEESLETIKAEDFPTRITNLPTGGGKSIDVYFSQQTPTFFEQTSTNSVTIDFGNTPALLDWRKISPPFKNQTLKKGLVFFWVRYNYTVSQNVEVLAETNWFTGGGTNQKLVVGWCDDFSEPITVTQENVGRLCVGVIGIKKGKYKSTILNQIIDSTTTINPSSLTCIYILSSIYSNAIEPSRAEDFRFVNTSVGERTGIFLSNDNLSKEIHLVGSGVSSCPSGMIAIELDVES